MNFGVYRIRNLINGKCYIGSSAQRGIFKRWSDHRYDLSNQRHHSSKLQRAWNKYGAENFVFEVLLYCDPENCLMYEQISMDHYKPEYNIAKVAGSQLGQKRTPEQCQALSQAHMGYKTPQLTKEKQSKANIGRHAGEKHPRSKLTTEQVLEIRALLATGKYSDAELARQFDTQRGAINKIKHRKRWKHV